MADIAAMVVRVINKLSQVATQEALLHVKVDDDICVLNDKLAWLRTFLEGVSERGRASRNQIEELWVKQAIELLFEAEDTLDEFSGMVVEKARLSRYRHWKALFKFQCFEEILVNHKLLRKIEALKDKLEQLDNQRTTHQIQDGRDSYEPVGSEVHVNELKDQLLKGENKRKVIAVIGSGNGITSFGKNVYDSSEVKNHFGVVAWKNLPLKFSLDETFSDIYCKVQEQMDQEEVDSCKQEDEGEALRALLRKRRYLIVFNGIASQDDWEEINNFLPDEENSSRVLLIPKHASEVAILSQSEDIITIRPAVALSLQECTNLFSQIVFENRTESSNEFNVYIPKVHAVTKGERWSISLLALLLRAKLSFKLWKKVFTHLESSTVRNPINRLLPLSFDSLPHQMKSCFLYFSAMPESTGFEADRLVRIWIAEGFVESRYRKTPEEIGEGYLKELILRSLVYVQEKNEFGGIAVVAVNERIRTFLQSVAQGSSFVTICDNANLVSPTMIRRIAVQNYVSKYVQVKNSLPKLRSFMCDCSEQYSKHHPHHTMKFLLESKFLRVIDLHGLLIKKLPKKIGNLTHLRYLGVHCEGLEKLPNSIGKLLNLQTLDIRKTSVQNLPESFWGIEALRHIIADTIKLPKRVGALYNLQTLQSADCTYWNHRSKFGLLEKITNIRSLSLEGLTTSQAREISNSLGNLLFLKHLCLKVKFSHLLPATIFTNPNAILRCLQILELHGQLDGQEAVDEEEISAQNTRLSMPKLVSITLIMSHIDQQFIDMLSKINSLERVSLYKAYTGQTIRFLSNGFQNVRELELSNLGVLKKWIEIDSETLPKLRKLTLSGCTTLENLPEGLEGLQLEEL
ncbi:Disease resistance protein RPM1 [Carex littledalei]|uniref:Disease resistance protein RPM1 n=1 Tax=Carex littledalei TaxID=544730 RepID=A0A833VPS3_9POAL|nr:Disease resistance protein RPM1 [Carex littledalei]